MCAAVPPGSGESLEDVAPRVAGVRQFFEVTVPGLLARNRQRARTINGRCLFDVGEEAAGGGRWVLDFTSDPPNVLAGAADDTDCQIILAPDDLLAVIDDPPTGQVLAWQGRLRVGGDRALMNRVTEVLFPSPSQDNRRTAGYYASLARLIPDPRFTFMNYGYAADHDDFSGLVEDDQPWRYAINLVRRTLDRVQIRGARVLDVGSGRGGPASYIARYLDPLTVTGLDASEDAVRFCQDRHRHPGLTFVHGSAEQLPFDDASFDVVVNVESSHCYLDRARFLAEVARVLRPGAAFCYSDVFRSDEMEDAERRLAGVPALRVTRGADITSQVMRAIELNRGSFSELLLSATNSKLRNMSLIANLVRTVNVEMYERFRTGEMHYHAWSMEKADT